MSRSAKITIPFGDGKRDYKLGIDQLEELQEKTGFGPEELYHRLLTGTWTKPACITEPLRLGLIGAGCKPIDALIFVERYAAPGYLMDAKTPAMSAIAAALLGAPEEDAKKGERKGRGRKTPGASPTADGASGSSTG
jgi:hypothetical protein